MKQKHLMHYFKCKDLNLYKRFISEVQTGELIKNVLENINVHFTASLYGKQIESVAVDKIYISMGKLKILMGTQQYIYLVEKYHGKPLHSSLSLVNSGKSYAILRRN